MNIYVSNLSFHTSEEDLKDLFGKFGEVTSAKIIMDRETNRSRGFAFVEFSTEEEAQKAIEGMNNKDFEGRVIVVNVAKPQTDRPAGPRREFRPRSGGNFGGGYDRQ